MNNNNNNHLYQIRDMQTILEALQNYCYTFREDPIEYIGYGDAHNFMQYIAEKTNMDISNTVIRVTNLWAYMDVCDGLELEREEIELETGTACGINIRVDYPCLDSWATQVAEYMASNRCSDNMYNKIMEKLKGEHVWKL